MNTALYSHCFHGGAFFSAIGEDFASLDRSTSIINADVLDAWFPPAPAVLDALSTRLPWLLRTSPPTHCAGLIEAIAHARGVAPENIVPGAGSSDLIFRALREWLTPASRVLMLDPTYGEYAHVLENVIGCQTARFPLRREDAYAVPLHRLHVVLQGGWDMVILVNPNSPTGRHISRVEMEALLAGTPPQTRVWVDETYVDYAGPGESIEQLASRRHNVVVCKSMSKVYALSGARVAYLCGHAEVISNLRAITPPWVVGLPSQLAAVRALESRDYYEARHLETHFLRGALAADLELRGWEVISGIANFLLCHLPQDGPSSAQVVSLARERGLFLRDAGAMGTNLGSHAIRIAVKDAVTNRRMLAIIDSITGRSATAIAS